MKLLALIAEMQEKTRVLRPVSEKLSPETTGGVINATMFWWLNPLLVSGFRKELALSDLFSVDELLSSERLEIRLQHAWNECKARQSLLLLKLC